MSMLDDTANPTFGHNIDWEGVTAQSPGITDTHVDVLAFGQGK